MLFGDKHITSTAYPRLESQLTKIARYMADGKRRTLRQISAACGASECSASARIRDLNNHHGWDIQNKEDPFQRGLHWYWANIVGVVPERPRAHR